jgi:biopolymer transport protein ExbB
MKKHLVLALAAVVMLGVAAFCSDAWAQDPAPGTVQPAPGAAPAQAKPQVSMSLWYVIVSSGALGVLIWLGLFGDAGVGVYLIVDSFIMISAKRVMPPTLVTNVTEAMQQGDVVKALHQCESEPSALANILIAGFSHVEEGFDVIQEAVSTAASLEAERMVQKVTWLAVVANLAPMLGLLGTVQGMIWCFAQIGSGVPDTALLAVNIAQALYTTAAGLCVAIPVIAVFYSIRNRASTMTLKMEALTMELIKDLRNVQVVNE